MILLKRKRDLTELQNSAVALLAKTQAHSVSYSRQCLVRQRRLHLSTLRMSEGCLSFHARRAFLFWRPVPMEPVELVTIPEGFYSLSYQPMCCHRGRRSIEDDESEGGECEEDEAREEQEQHIYATPVDTPEVSETAFVPVDEQQQQFVVNMNVDPEMLRTSTPVGHRETTI